MLRLVSAVENSRKGRLNDKPEELTKPKQSKSKKSILRRSVSRSPNRSDRLRIVQNVSPIDTSIQHESNSFANAVKTDQSTMNQR